MALMQDWHADSIKRAFIILDEPPHGGQYTNDEDEIPDDYPEGSPENLNFENLVNEFQAKNIEMTVF